MKNALEYLKSKRAEAEQKISTKRKEKNIRVSVGMATCEIAAGSEDIMAVFQEAIAKELPHVYLSQKGCVGRCNLEPTVEIIIEGKIPTKYGKVTVEKAKQIIERHLKKGEVIKEWILQ